MMDIFEGATMAPDLTTQERAEHIAEWVRITGEKAKAQVAPSDKPHTGSRANQGINAAIRELRIDKRNDPSESHPSPGGETGCASGVLGIDLAGRPIGLSRTEVRFTPNYRSDGATP